MLEQTIEDEFVAHVHALGGKAYKLTDESGNGFPDRTVLIQGQCIFFEFKRPGGRISPQQEQRVVDFHELGLSVVVADNIEYAKHWLKLILLNRGVHI